MTVIDTMTPPTAPYKVSTNQHKRSRTTTVCFLSEDGMFQRCGIFRILLRKTTRPGRSKRRTPQPPRLTDHPTLHANTNRQLRKEKTASTPAGPPTSRMKLQSHEISVNEKHSCRVEPVFTRPPTGTTKATNIAKVRAIAHTPDRLSELDYSETKRGSPHRTSHWNSYFIDQRISSAILLPHRK